MARNPLITKRNRQRFQRRRGTFQPLSEQGMNGGETFVDSKLKPFWSENMKGRPRGGGQSGVDRSNFKQEDVGFVNYRQHARHLGKPETVVNASPEEVFWKSLLYPGSKFISDQRKVILAKMAESMKQAMLPVEYSICPFPNTPNHEVRLCIAKEAGGCWWWVERKFRVVRTSITYGSKERALYQYKCNAVMWKSTAEIPPD